VTHPEYLAMELIARPMTKDEICKVLGSEGAPVTRDYAASVIGTMRHDVLPELGAWCPRPTHESGYIYRVMDKVPTNDEKKLQIAGAKMMLKDNTRRLQTMLETAEPYANLLDLRTRQGKAAEIVVNSARLGLDALAMIEVE
jgi:hypothetical protein